MNVNNMIQDDFGLQSNYEWAWIIYLIIGAVILVDFFKFNKDTTPKK